ncbi:hypothetical protein GCM10027258_62590 [Amycolatopsis stemonae]
MFGKGGDERTEKRRAKEEAHDRTVRANEDEVIAMANEPDATDYVKEVAEDIKMRRAGYNPHGRNN